MTSVTWRPCMRVSPPVTPVATRTTMASTAPAIRLTSATSRAVPSLNTASMWLTGTVDSTQVTVVASAAVLQVWRMILLLPLVTVVAPCQSRSSTLSPTFSDCAIQHPVGVEGFNPRTMQVSASVRYALPDQWLLYVFYYLQAPDV